LGEKELSRTKRKAILINVSRGGIVDEVALARLLGEGHFRHVALDVFEQEPLPSESPLRGLPRTTLTPHCVGHTAETVASFPSAALSNITNVLAGRLPVYVRNPDVNERWLAKWA